MAVQSQNGIRQQAELLAEQNRQADPQIEGVYWFPHPDEVRLVETTPEVPRSLDQQVHPFYFRAAPQEKLPAASAVALIRPDEVGQLRLPDGWGEWDDAIKL